MSRIQLLSRGGVKLLLLISISLLDLHAAMASDTNSSGENLLKSKIFETQNSYVEFNNFMWKNPAMRYDMYGVGFTDVNISSRFEDNSQIYLTEKGYCSDRYSFNATSFQPISPKIKLYGGANYHNSKLRDLLWCENSDYDIIYPYVVGDSIGGDMNAEQYSFMGGGVTKYNNWTLGAELGYRATISYRTVDPRPKNIVSDLKAKIGVAYSLNDYSIGLNANIRSYYQKSSISFLSDKGEQPVYQMTGLGNDYVRFSGDQKSTNYSGYECGVGINLLPKSRYGFNSDISADLLHIIKRLPNKRDAPINEFDELGLNANISWYAPLSNSNEYGVSLTADMTNRTGTENYIGDVVGDVYEVISQSETFNAPKYEMCLSAIYSTISDANTWSWSIKPLVTYSYIKQEHLTTSRKFEMSNIAPKIEAKIIANFPAFVVSLNLFGGYNYNLNSNYDLVGMDMNSSVAKGTKANIDYLSSSYSQLGAKIEFNYSITQSIALVVRGGYTNYNYSDSYVNPNIHVTEISLGLIL